MNKKKQELDISKNNADQEKRRQLLKGIVASTPVILSMTSRPVLAGANCTASGQLSGNMSDIADHPCMGSGCSGNNWRENLNEFHYDYPSDAFFNTVFGIDLFGASVTLGEVINKTPTPSLATTKTCIDGTTARIEIFGKQATTALQNAASEVSFDLTVTDVMNDVKNAYTNAIAGQPVGIIDCDILETAYIALRNLNNQNPQECPWF